MLKQQENFGRLVFNDKVMRNRLPKESYEALKLTLKTGKRLPPEVASMIANAMKDWAIENGCTHFSHWFQPLTGMTAEKHDSFLHPVEGGNAIMEFSGKELVKGEPDASSLPSGGLRATFEARGYTAWDPTSFSFIKDKTLYIPTAFCSYGAHALDLKTPLLRSMDALNRQALRILRLFQNFSVQRVTASVGAEQEYFLVDRDLFLKRDDLIYTGRTLYGAKPPKGQELGDHYYGSIPLRVSEFMNDLNEALWALGIPAKTEHNEAAPAQHELAPIFEQVNIAVDHNQMMMDVLKRTALKHEMVCLLHEKPFNGINGSGKHNNWSLSTDTGINLFEPGDTPQENAQFLLFLTAVIKAVDLYSDLLRLSVATASNDCRLGGFEAPPSIISIFLGDELSNVLDALLNHNTYVKETKAEMSIGVHVLPRIPKDTSDRNRTSPFAFTGNKFEFRSPGSAMSIAEPNTVLNTCVADVLEGFADELEKCEDFQSAREALIIRTIREHKRILFNGNSYAEDWAKEAKERGLPIFPQVPDCLNVALQEKNIALFTRQRVLSPEELQSRNEVISESYCKTIRIEALTMLEMLNKQILPSVVRYSAFLAKSINLKREALKTEPPELEMLTALDHTEREIMKCRQALQDAYQQAISQKSWTEQAHSCGRKVIPAMAKLRKAVDLAEEQIPGDEWPFPGYGKLLFGI